MATQSQGRPEEIQGSILDLLKGFEEAIAKAERILSPDDEPQNAHVQWAMEEGTKAYLQGEADDCNSGISKHIEQLEALDAQQKDVTGSDWSPKTRAAYYAEKLAELNQRANGILQDEEETETVTHSLTQQIEEADARIKQEAGEFNKFLESIENRRLSDMDSFPFQAIRISTSSSLRSELNDCEEGIADDIEQLNLLVVNPVWTPPTSLALWASAKQRAERLIKELSDDDTPDEPEIEYFKSEGDRIIYALVELNGTARQNALEVTLAQHSNKSAATEWRNNLAKVIHPDICPHRKAGEALVELAEMYEEMTRR